MPGLPKSSDLTKYSDGYVARLAAAVISINMFVIVLIGFSLHRSNLIYQERAAVTSQNLALSLRNNIEDTFDKTDLGLFAIIEEVARQRSGKGIDKQTLNMFMARTISHLPHLEGLRVADAQGSVYYNSDTSAPFTTIPDRAYFIRLRDNPDAGLVISKPIISRSINKWVITCARRLNQPDGSFAGIVFAVFRLEHFTKIFSSLDMGRHGIVNLFDKDMDIYVRYPDISGPGGSVGKDLKNTTIQGIIQAGRTSATFVNPSPLDGIKRTISFQKVSDKQLYVLVGVAMDDYLDEWRKEALIMSALAALFFLFTFISAWLMYQNRKGKLSDLQALRSSESRYRTLYDCAPLGISTHSSDFHFINVNEAFCSMLGYSQEELAMLTLNEITHPDDVSTDVESVNLLLSDSISFYTAEKRYIRKNQEIVWGSATITLVRDKEGCFLYFLAIIEDISERKAAADSLLWEKEFFIEVLNSLPGIFYMIGPTENFLRWNATFEKTTEYSSEELSLLSPLDLFCGADRDLIRERIQEVFVSGTSVAEAELVSKSGIHIPYFFSGRLIQIEEIPCLIGMGVDISERKRAEEARNKALFFIETLLKSSPTGIVVYEGDTGNAVMANPAMAEIIGGTIEYLRSTNFREIATWRETGFSQCAEAVLLDGITRRMEKEFVTSFGKSVALNIFFSKAIIDGRPYLMFIAMDISDKIRLEEENKLIEEQMLHVQKLESLGVLAGGIAHDFNNILTAVLGNADLARMRLPENSPARENLVQIEKAADRAAELARQMLAYSGKGRFVIENQNITGIVEEMAQMLEVSISKKAVLRFNFTPDLPAVEADATQLRQVIMNLVINASEAIGDNSGVITISTGALNCERSYLSDSWIDDHLPEGLYVYFEVSDTGCGIERNLIPKIFDPFFTTKFTGRGLGMSAVLGIIRGHKGAIKVYSEKGEGTTFKLLLPATLQTFAAQIEAEPADWIWKGAGTVLLVDDEESIRALGRDMLDELGFDALTASDGLEALAVFKSNKDIILCVILDLTMPKMDGEQTFRELRRIKQDVRVIISSGFNELEVTQKFVGKGLSGFIQKPYKILEVSKKLREILEVA